jgi:O-antigen/teichoic acid export membrane protein/GT2 family glycosyltransferase
MISFSIVIPTYRRPAAALACLASMAEQDYPRDAFEVVLVEDGEGPEPLLDEDLAPFGELLNLRIIRQENAGPAAARNRGATEATGTFVAFTDDDCKPARDWLTRLAERFERDPDVVLGGHTNNAIENSAPSEASQVLIDYITEYFGAKGAPFFASNNLALSRSNFERVGGFDGAFGGAGGEDREFCTRCLHHDLELVHAPEAVMNHYHHLSLKRFLRQHYNYGRGAFTYHQAQIGREGHGVQLEPLRFYTDLIRYPSTLPRERGLRWCRTLMLISQAANAFGYFAEKLAPRSYSGGGQRAGASDHQPGQAAMIAGQAGGSWIANVLGIGCRYLAMLGATHILGKALFGDYTLSLAITGVFAVVAMLGFSPGVLPFLSRARRSGDEEEIRAVVRSSLLPVSILSIALTALVWLSASWAGEVIFDKPNLHRFLGPLSGLVALGSICTMLVTLLQGFMSVKERVWIERVVVSGTIAIGMGISWLAGFKVSGAVVSTLVGAGAGLVAGHFMLARRAPGVLTLGSPAAPLLVRKLLAYSWPLMGTSMLAFLLLWTDVLFMGVYTDSDEVGVYAACARIAVIALIAHDSLGPVFVARLSDLFTADDWPGIRHLNRLTAHWTMWPGLTLAWTFALWGGDVLSLFGPEFRTGAAILTVLCLGKAVTSSTGMTGRVLGITGRARLNLVNMSLLVGGNVILNVLLIPHYGGMGAAWATAVSLALVRLLQVAEIKVIYGMLPWSRKSLIPLFGTAAFAAFVYPIREGFDFRWGWVFPMGAFMLACAALFFVTGVGEDDRAVWTALRRRLRG